MQGLVSWEEILWDGPHHLFDSFKKTYEYPRDLFLEDECSVAAAVSCSLSDVRIFKEQLYSIITPNSASLVSEILPKRRYGFGLCDIDAILGGGLESRTICELYGPAGSGKTNLCISLMSNILLSFDVAKILCISNQEKFGINRLVTSLGSNAQDKTLDRLHLQYFLDPDVELHFFRHGLSKLMEEYQYKLIIYDGIASNARIIAETFDKAEFIHQIIGSIRALFADFDFGVLFTNQVTDIPGESKQQSALGLALSNCVNIKLLLEKDEFSSKRKLSVEKSLHQPLDSCVFIFSETGIKGVAES